MMVINSNVGNLENYEEPDRGWKVLICDLGISECELNETHV